MTDDAIPTAHRIELVDGDTTTPLSAEALVVAIFVACGLLLVKNPAGQIVVISVDHDKVATLALQLQALLDQGDTIRIEQNLIARPGLV